jgi:hypothetical protein
VRLGVDLGATSGGARYRTSEVTMRWMCGLALVGCADRPCPAANEPRADDEAVSGATVDALVTALQAQPFLEVPFVWRDGPETRATGSIEVVPGTGTRVQREDCLKECRTSYHLTMACGPDELWADAHGTASTADGRVVDAAWTGSIVATALDGPLVWWLSPEPIPIADLAGTLDAAEVAQKGDARDLGLRVFLSGADGVLDAVSFGLAYARGEGELEASGVAALGATP